MTDFRLHTSAINRHLSVQSDLFQQTAVSPDQLSPDFRFGPFTQVPPNGAEQTDTADNGALRLSLKLNACALLPPESIQRQMVAETLAQPKPRKKPQGFQSRIPLPLKLKVRSLYIIQQLSPQEIGAQVGMTRQQIQNLVHREKWTAVKRSAKERLQQKADLRVQEEVAEIHDAFALKTEELAMGSLDKAAKRMPQEDENACRDLQALSQTAKNFIGIARQIRGMDAAKRDMPGGNTIIFLGSAPRVGDSVKRPELNVTPNGVVAPAIEIQAAPDSPKVT